MTYKNPDILISIRSKDWDQALNIIRNTKNKKLIETTDKNGKNVLHHACSRAVPVEVMRFLLSLSCDAGLSQDLDGKTPLHYAIDTSLLDIAPMVIRAYPRAAHIKDNKGQIPLHFAIEKNISKEIIEALLVAYPNGAITKNNMGNTPLKMYFEKWNLGLKHLMKHLKDLPPSFVAKLNERNELGEEYKIKDLGINAHGCNDFFNIGLYFTIRNVYGMIVLLLKAATQGTMEKSTDEPFQVLHAALRVPTCPWSVFNLLLKVHPDQVKQKDFRGNLPFHLAAASNGDEISSIIESLLNLYPGAAKTLNYEGRLPLSLAIESGKYGDHGGVKTILFAAPGALRTRDKKKRLLPFMEAATVGELTKAEFDERNKLDDVEKLNSALFWLKEEPSLVSWGIADN